MESVQSLMREQIFSSLDEIPPVAPVASRVMRMAEDPNSSAADLARVISRDQGLTSKVLHTCGSTFYGLAQPPTSLSQAVVVLGLRTVRNLVLVHSFPVSRTANGRMSDVGADLWKHSVGCALGCRLLAMEKREIDPETAFLVGLFHDLGRSLIHLIKPKVYETLCSAAGRPTVAMERTILGTDHTEVGARALERMDLSPELADVVRRHHAPLAELPTGALYVRAAEEILTVIQRPESSALEAVRTLGLTQEALERIGQRLRASLNQEESFFR